MVGAKISICHIKKKNIRYNVIDFWEDSEQIFEVYVCSKLLKIWEENAPGESGQYSCIALFDYMIYIYSDVCVCLCTLVCKILNPFQRWTELHHLKVLLWADTCYQIYSFPSNLFLISKEFQSRECATP